MFQYITYLVRRASLLYTEGSGEVPIQILSLPPESGGAYFTVCIAYGEGVVLIIDVVRANEFLQDEIGIGTSPDPSVHSKLVRDDTSDYNNTIILKRRVSVCTG